MGKMKEANHDEIIKGQQEAEKKDEPKFKLHWTSKILLFLLIALVITGSIMLYQNYQKNQMDADERGVIAQELTAANITLYTTSTCPHCKTQKDMFKEEIRYLRIVTCDVKPDDFCQVLTGVPAWRLPDGKVILGVLTWDNLKELAVACTPERGCNLKQQYQNYDNFTLKV